MGYLVLEYDLVEDYLDRRGEFREEHLALAQAAQARGDLLLAGALAEPADRALFVWRTDDRGLLEDFAESDPYVVNGIVNSWTVRPWNVAVGASA